MIDRILNMFGLARVTLVDDAGPIQIVQVDEGPIGPGSKRIIAKVKHILHFGFTSVPPLTSEILLVRLGGLRAQTIALGTNHQPSRLKDLQPGDTAIYDVRGAKIVLGDAGILIDGAGLPITVQNFGTLTADGDVHVTGDIVSRSAGTAVSLNALRDAYHAHKHAGVQAGSASTGNTDHDV